MIEFISHALVYLCEKRDSYVLEVPKLWELIDRVSQMLIMKRDSEDNEFQSPEMRGGDFPIHSLHLTEEAEVPGGQLH